MLDVCCPHQIFMIPLHAWAHVVLDVHQFIHSHTIVYMWRNGTVGIHQFTHSHAIVYMWRNGTVGIHHAADKRQGTVPGAGAIAIRQPPCSCQANLATGNL